MKIAYYLPSLYTAGGLERIITLKANYFADHFGYSVTIITSEQQGRKLYYELSKNVNHIDLGVLFDLTENQSKIRKLLSYPFKYYLFKKKFSSFLYEYKPDITISTLRRELNFINSINDGSIKIGEFHVTRNSYHAMSINSNKIFLRILKKLWARLFLKNIKKLSKFIILTNEEAANWPELKNIKVISNPLTFYPENISNCSSKKIIAAGRYSFQKGFDLLIESWSIVAKRNPDWKLYIYGGENKKEFIQQVKELKLESSCFLEDAVPDIIDKYTESSIFVLSSRYEGFGMVITEAMACGVPAVSFACPCGPKDIIKDEIDGLLVENGNIQELADKICYLIEHENIRKEMGKQARINVERFKIENIAMQWKELFDSLLDSKKQ